MIQGENNMEGEKRGAKRARARLSGFYVLQTTLDLNLVCCFANLGTHSCARRHKKQQVKHSAFLWSVTFTYKQKNPKQCTRFTFPLVVGIFLNTWYCTPPFPPPPFFPKFSHLVEVKQYFIVILVYTFLITTAVEHLFLYVY